MKSPTTQQIRQARLNAGLSVAGLAKLIGVTRMSVHNWEAGVHPMKPRDFDYMKIKINGIC